MKKTSLTLLTFFLLFQIAFSQNASPIAFDNKAFQNPPKSSKVHTWWHWMQGSISKQGITKDLESMKAQGISEATILNIGLIDDKNYLVQQVKFGSEEWYDMFKWALTEAKRLGITIGAHKGEIKVSLKHVGESGIEGEVTLPPTVKSSFEWQGKTLVLTGGLQKVKM
jgi:hypothetical protein